MSSAALKSFSALLKTSKAQQKNPRRKPNVPKMILSTTSPIEIYPCLLNLIQKTLSFLQTPSTPHGEVLKALSGCKNGKAKGTDDIHNEQLKYTVSSSAFVGIVLKLMLLLWNCPILPAKWLSCKISTLYKKESPLLAKNY